MKKSLSKMAVVGIVLIMVAVVFQTTIANARLPQERALFIVYYDSTSALSLLPDSGVEILEDYGTYALVSMTQQASTQAGAVSILDIEDYPDTNTIYVPSGIIDTKSTLSLSSSNLMPGGKYFVQFSAPIKKEWYDALNSQVDIIQPYYKNAYLVSIPDSGANGIMSVPHLSWIGEYLPEYKLPETMTCAPGPAKLNIVCYKDIDMVAIASKLALLGATIVNSQETTMSVSFVVEGDGLLATAIADIPEVYSIGEFYQNVQQNKDAQWILQTGTSNDRSIWDNGVMGEGQLVGISDQGLDTGSAGPGHFAFKDPVSNVIGPSHRKVAAYVLCSYTGSTEKDGDNNGHGTHTAGTIAGNDAPNGGSSANDGMAPEAKLAIWDVGSGGSINTPDPDITPLWDDCILKGTTIHSASWGHTTSLYDYDSHYSDMSMYNDDQFLIVLAAGNYGSLPIISPSNAKNVICAGGSSGLTYVYGSENYGPFQNRIKPDTLAPYYVYSADVGSENFYVGKGGTSMSTPAVAGSAALVQEYFADGYYPYGVDGTGTAFQPSSALVKAAIVNCGEDIASGSGPGGSCAPGPDANDGWGRMELDNVLYFSGGARNLFVDDYTTGFTTTGEEETYQISVLSGSEPLKIALCWMDYPSPSNAASTLINDLDITVTAPDGTEYRGNKLTGEWSTDDPTTFDHYNTVEKVAVQTPQTGQYTITVSAYKVDNGPAKFGLIVSGNLSTSSPAPGPDLTVATGDISFNPSSPNAGDTVTVSVQVHNTGTDAATSVGVAVYDGDPGAGGTQIGSTQTIASIASGGSEIASVNWDTTGLDGSYDIYAVVDPGDSISESNEGNNQASKSVSVSGAPVELSLGAVAAISLCSMMAIVVVRVRFRD